MMNRHRLQYLSTHTGWNIFSWQGKDFTAVCLFQLIFCWALGSSYTSFQRHTMAFNEMVHTQLEKHLSLHVKGHEKMVLLSWIASHISLRGFEKIWISTTNLTDQRKPIFLHELSKVNLSRKPRKPGVFFNTFEKTQGEKNSMFLPPSENSMAIISKTSSLWDF